MELSNYELHAIDEYISTKGPHRSPVDIVRSCRALLIRIMQDICVRKYKLDIYSNEFKNPLIYVVRSGFFTKPNPIPGKDKYIPRSPRLEKIYNQVNIVKGNRELTDYGVFSATEEEANQCLNGIKIIAVWYFNNYRKIYLDNVSNLSAEQKIQVKELFTLELNFIEKIIERDKYYLVLLIDSSQSMLWPYLKDKKNWNSENTTDYQNAVTEVQSAMQFAHEKALTAFRGSSICKEGYLYIYQSTFNHKRKHLNDPEILSPEKYGTDKVVKINRTNYYPDGMTALYDNVDESLKVVYNHYLLPVLEKEKRVDKVIICVITDGEDTIVEGISKNSNPNEYEIRKRTKLRSIANTISRLRGDENSKYSFLYSSVLIGLTSNHFTEDALKKIKKELVFDESISINQTDEYSIRKAFKLFSTNAINR